VPTPEVASTLLGKATMKWKSAVTERRFERGGVKGRSRWGERG
jgi:hypothetical protein